MASIPSDMDPSMIPTELNPSGRGSNFVDPPTLATAVTGTGLTMIILSVVLVTVRLYSNFNAVRKLGWDDYSCVAALVLTIGFTCIVISDNAIAHHGWDIPLSVVLEESFIKKNYALGVLVGPCIFFAKTSIFLLYIRLFGPIRWVRHLVYFGIVLLFLVTWITIPLASFYCTPRPGSRWDTALYLKCQKIAVTGVIQGTFYVIVDIFIVVLPLPVISRLNLEFRKKLGLAGVFMTALIGICTSGLALYYKYLIWKHQDLAWNAAKAWICMFVEIYVAIMIGCSPAIFSFWKNQLSKTEIVSTFWSLFPSYRSIRSAAKGAGNGASVLKRSSSKSLERLTQNGYFELNEAGRQNPSMTIHSTPSTGEHPAQKAGVITKSITLHQSSQKRAMPQNYDPNLRSQH